jgi:para-aminobenzoate synthetase component 1
MAYYILNSYKLKVPPLEVFEALKNERNCFFLDSSLNSNHSMGRYSFLGIDPFYTLETKNLDPFGRLRELLVRYKIANLKNSLPFPAGAVGYFAYDLGFLLEKKLRKLTADDLTIPDSLFSFYNTVITIDNIKKIVYIFSTGFPEKAYHLQKALSNSHLKRIQNLLSQIRPHKNNKKNRPEGNPQVLKSSFSREGYVRAVHKAKKYIGAGDIYQVNLSQRLESTTGLAGPQIYERLRKISPSYFGAYLDCGDFQILSSSPERFLRLEKNLVTTRPMKGTRPRSKNKTRDFRFKNELLESAKDKAELMMIVDLERNDLGKVCNYDSIKVNALRELEKYSTVFQTTATISGRLHKDKDRIDLLRATFPGGSITGCPKIRSMEIIEELEPTRRSIYTGSLGYLSFTGDMDFNILIRTILKKKNKIYFGVGAGIVADSRPESEYEETLAKARAMMEAIK